jgi:hypothetical protein
MTMPTEAEIATTTIDTLISGGSRLYSAGYETNAQGERSVHVVGTGLRLGATPIQVRRGDQVMDWRDAQALELGLKILGFLETGDVNW